MAVGDDSGYDASVGTDATAGGYPLVPDDGDDTALISNGAQEINRTRDFAAALKALVPQSKAAWRTAMGLSSGTAVASGGQSGSIYVRIMSY